MVRFSLHRFTGVKKCEVINAAKHRTASTDGKRLLFLDGAQILQVPTGFPCCPRLKTAGWCVRPPQRTLHFPVISPACCRVFGAATCSPFVHTDIDTILERAHRRRRGWTQKFQLVTQARRPDSLAGSDGNRDSVKPRPVETFTWRQNHRAKTRGRRGGMCDVVRYGISLNYDVAGAFIKTMRGSDPDAALHYLAQMIAAGEDPRFYRPARLLSPHIQMSAHGRPSVCCPWRGWPQLLMTNAGVSERAYSQLRRPA